MQAELKRLHSPDIENLKAYTPQEKENFSFLLQLMVGPRGDAGAESFDVVVCTPDWLKQRHGMSDIVIGRHFLIVFQYDYERLFHFLQECCARCTGDTWQEIAENLDRVGRWEFEDYERTSS
jgi:hypothetical protein